MLCNLLLRSNRDRFDPSVVALIDDLTVAGPVVDAGIPIATMGMKPGVPDPRGLGRLIDHVRRLRPAVVQTWMDHSNLIGGLAARLASRARVVWGIHHCDHAPGLTKRSTLLTVAACAAISRRVPARIVFCSQQARERYAERGFAREKAAVIPNGIDTRAFRPDAAARADGRRELGIDARTPVLGLIARYHPFKDHATFLRAAAKVVSVVPEVRFVLCGERVDSRNTELTAMVNSLGLGGRCHLLGARRDVARVLAAMDVVASSSITEAFPLALVEAMSCGAPCAVTDVGDSALIVAGTGRVVAPRDPDALAAACAELLALDPQTRAVMGAAARRRVCEHFDLGAVAQRYESLYDQLLFGRASKGAPRAPVRHTPSPTPPARHADLPSPAEALLCASK
jgi:glycosyltransferase involved in cell wall biosynthesis